MKSYFEIYYRQTMEDRYNTDTNGRVRTLIESWGLPIVEEYGGTSFMEEDYPLNAEEAFIVETEDEESLSRLVALIEEIVGQPVTVGQKIEFEV